MIKRIILAVLAVFVAIVLWLRRVVGRRLVRLAQRAAAERGQAADDADGDVGEVVEYQREEPIGNGLAFARGVDFRVRVDGEGLDEVEVKRNVRGLARRVFAGEIE